MNELIEALIDCGAVKFGNFTLKSGLQSKYYVDIKLASMSPSVLREIAAAMSAKLDDLGFDLHEEEHEDADILYAGMELGAVPILVATSLLDEVPYLVVRKAAKEHGTQQRIEGKFVQGEGVIVMEDVTTTAGTALEACEQLKLAGLEVRHVITVVDRQQGAAEKFAELGIPFDALVTADEILKAYHE